MAYSLKNHIFMIESLLSMRLKLPIQTLCNTRSQIYKNKLSIDEIIGKKI